MELNRLYIVANTTKPGALRALAILKAWCSVNDIQGVAVEQVPPRPIEPEGALIVALGGDGTVLRAADLFADTGIPILGANMGSLGFLTQVKANTLTQALEEVIHDRFVVEERMRIAYRAAGRTGTALNDIVLIGNGPTRFCELDLTDEHGDVIASYPGDGLIISTPTGSTAYNLSAGGPVVVPHAKCIAVTPLATHRLGLRPLIFPADEALTVRVNTPAALIVDGDEVDVMPAASVLTVMRASQSTIIINVADTPPFFRFLAEKLNWGAHTRRRDNSL